MKPSKQSRSHKSKPQARKRQKQKKAAIQQQTPSAYDIEELLVKSLLDKSKAADKGLVIEDLIYSLTQKLSNAAYKFGYSVGKAVFLNSAKSNNELIAVLRRLGFSNITYHPFRDALVIKSGSRNHGVIGVGARIHFFESGIIAGYLSAHSDEKINTVEKECVYNGDKYCRFVSNAGRSFESYSAPSPESVIDSIATGMHSIKFGNRSSAEYHLLPLLPMMQQPLRSEIAKILYITGMELSARHKGKEAEEVLRNAARYFGISRETISIKPKNISIRLKYAPHNSNTDFIELSTAIMSGFIKGKISKEPSVYINVDKNMNYVVDITTAVRK